MLLFERDISKLVNTMTLLEIFSEMAKTINYYYIVDLFSENNKIVLYNIADSYIDIDNCPCGLIYNVKKSETDINIYIMFIATKYKYRKVGYASIFIKEFIEKVRLSFGNKGKNVKIILDSLQTAVTFYEHIGFVWTLDDNSHHHIFDINEKNKNEHFIMVYYIVNHC